jgi:hypothetical protein
MVFLFDCFRSAADFRGVLFVGSGAKAGTLISLGFFGDNEGICMVILKALLNVISSECRPACRMYAGRVLTSAVAAAHPFLITTFAKFVF